MRGNLFPTTVYLDDETRKQIHRLALVTRKPKAAVVREVLQTGLKSYKTPVSNDAKNLLTLAQKARLLLKDEKLPKDLSKRHNTYLWKESTKK